MAPKTTAAAGRQRPARRCVFCEIAAGRAPARLVSPALPRGEAGRPRGVVAFHNRLDWARVMLLVTPVAHQTQRELWAGPTLSEAASTAVRLGRKLCPEGFRLLSNFGRLAHQTQEHAHIHVVSGPDASLPDRAPPPQSAPLWNEGRLRADLVDAPGVPWAARVTVAGIPNQNALWLGADFPACGRAALRVAADHTPRGFRFVSNFVSPAAGAPGGGPPGLLVLGGGQLDLYA